MNNYHNFSPVRFNEELTEEEQNFVIALMQEDIRHMVDMGASVVEVAERTRDYYLAFQGLEDRMSNEDRTV